MMSYARSCHFRFVLKTIFAQLNMHEASLKLQSVINEEKICVLFIQNCQYIYIEASILNWVTMQYLSDVGLWVFLNMYLNLLCRKLL